MGVRTQDLRESMTYGLTDLIIDMDAGCLLCLVPVCSTLMSHLKISLGIGRILD